MCFYLQTCAEFMTEQPAGVNTYTLHELPGMLLTCAWLQSLQMAEQAQQQAKQAQQQAEQAQQQAEQVQQAVVQVQQEQQAKPAVQATAQAPVDEKTNKDSSSGFFSARVGLVSYAVSQILIQAHQIAVDVVTLFAPVASSMSCYLACLSNLHMMFLAVAMPIMAC